MAQSLFKRHAHLRASSSQTIRPHSNLSTKVAVLYQAVEPPVINGIRKPPKAGGYQDSGADIAYALATSKPSVSVITPTFTESLDPANDIGWSFPDTESGILAAVSSGATHLWANTNLSSSHPLQTSPQIAAYAGDLRVVGQPPNLVQLYDNKNYVNNLLRRKTDLPLPRAWNVTAAQGVQEFFREHGDQLTYPIVGKPPRGRGSYGVKMCTGPEELKSHIENLLDESNVVMLEEFLGGEEATVTVMPPSQGTKDYWALPIVSRFNHNSGIVPYSGKVAVTENSRVITSDQEAEDSSYSTIARQCEHVAKILCVTGPIRVDVRRRREDQEFANFDVNMKPNMTGPGRPGRENQASLTAMAASALGWDYARLLRELLASAKTLKALRNIKAPKE